MMSATGLHLSEGVCGDPFVLGSICDLSPTRATTHHQGWNDGCSLNQTAEYEQNMVNLVKDLRKAWKNPKLPVSIAVSGFDGFAGEEASRKPAGCWDKIAYQPQLASKIGCNCMNDRGCRRLDVVLSQFGAADPKRHPDLGGAVSAMETRGYQRTQYSPAPAQGYHWVRGHRQCCILHTPLRVPCAC